MVFLYRPMGDQQGPTTPTNLQGNCQSITKGMQMTMTWRKVHFMFKISLKYMQVDLAFWKQILFGNFYMVISGLLGPLDSCI